MTPIRFAVFAKTELASAPGMVDLQLQAAEGQAVLNGSRPILHLSVTTAEAALYTTGAAYDFAATAVKAS